MVDAKRIRTPVFPDNCPTFSQGRVTAPIWWIRSDLPRLPRDLALIPTVIIASSYPYLLVDTQGIEPYTIPHSNHLTLRRGRTSCTHMVPPVGIAPTSPAFQTSANLSQLRWDCYLISWFCVVLHHAPKLTSSTVNM